MSHFTAERLRRAMRAFNRSHTSRDALRQMADARRALVAELGKRRAQELEDTYLQELQTRE